MTGLLRQAIKEGRKIVFADEVMFTKQTSKAREWSCRRENVKVDEAKCLTNYVAVIASISFERERKFLICKIVQLISLYFKNSWGYCDAVMKISHWLCLLTI